MPALPEDTAPPTTRIRLAEVVDVLSKGALGFSLIVYVIGFIVAGGHFARIGVEPQVLSHDVYFAAGLSFVMVIGLAWATGVFFRAEVFPHLLARRWWRASFEGIAALSLGDLVFRSQLHMAWPGLLFCGSASAFSAGSPIPYYRFSAK